MFAIRSLDGRPLNESRRIRVFHGTGDQRLKLRAEIRTVRREQTVAMWWHGTRISLSCPSLGQRCNLGDLQGMSGEGFKNIKVAQISEKYSRGMRMLKSKPYGSNRSVVAFALILCVLFSVNSAVPLHFSGVYAAEEYIYYGVVPAKIWQYNLTDADDINSGWRLDTDTVDNSSLVAIVASEDNTNVKLYSLEGNELLSEAQLGDMEKHLVSLPNGTTFKVVSDSLVSVLLMGYVGIPAANASEGPTPNTFHASTDGAYVGKEFVFMACQGTIGENYLIIALEKAEVTMIRDDGDERTYSLDVNTFREVMLRPFRTYRITSTGNIMVQSGRPVDIWGDSLGFFVPSPEGGFVGTTFYTWSTTSWDPGENYGFRVSATQDAKITVWNLQTKEQMLATEVRGGSGFGFMARAEAIVVQSDEPVTLSYVHNGTINNSLGGEGIYDGYGSGVTYIGVRPGETTPIYLPVDSYVEVYIFAYEDSEVTVDGISRPVPADSYFLLTQPGTHTIRSNKNVVAQVLHWPFEPETQGLLFNGVLIPCIQTVNVVTDVTLTPLGEGFPMMYVVIGAAAGVVVAVIAVFVLRRGRSSKPV